MKRSTDLHGWVKVMVELIWGSPGIVCLIHAVVPYRFSPFAQWGN